METAQNITVEQAKQLKAGDRIYTTAVKNADGTMGCYRVTSVKTWKRDPYRIEVRARRGLYDNVVLTADHLRFFCTEQQYNALIARQERAERNEAMQQLPYRLQRWGEGSMYSRDDRFLRVYKSPQRWLRDNAATVADAVIMFYTLHEGRPSEENVLVLKVTMDDGRYMFMRWGDVELCRRFCFRTFASFRMTDEVYNYHRRLHAATRRSASTGYYGTDH